MKRQVEKAKGLLKEAYRRELIGIFTFWAWTRKAEGYNCLTIIEKVERLLLNGGVK